MSADTGSNPAADQPSDTAADAAAGFTAGQTVGPFFHIGLVYPGADEIVPRGAPGARRLSGHVLDGAGEAVPDALVEIWQADTEGSVPRTGGSLRRDGWTFTGWGRAATDATGRYSFSTVTPGPVDDGVPFLAVTVFARGLLHRLTTRAYLPVAADMWQADALLSRLTPAQRATLLVEETTDGWAFDIRLQQGTAGEPETVFLHPTAPVERE